MFAVDEVDGDVVVCKRLVISQEGVGHGPGVVAALHAAHHLGHGIVDDADFCLYRA